MRLHIVDMLLLSDLDESAIGDDGTVPPGLTALSPERRVDLKREIGVMLAHVRSLASPTHSPHPLAGAFASDVRVAAHSLSPEGEMNISFRVSNRGSLPWDNRTLPRSAKFRVGLRARHLQSGEILLESREEFPVDVVSSGDDFALSARHRLSPSHPLPAILLEIQVLKESEFWFSDAGQKPHLCLLLNEELLRRPRRAVEISLKEFTSPSPILLTTSLTNTGRDPLGRIRISLEAQAAGEAPEIEPLYFIDRLLPLEQVDVPLDLTRFIPSSGALTFTLVAHEDDECLASSEPITLSTMLPKPQGLLHSTVTIEAVVERTPGLIAITGSVQNTGLLSWHSSQLDPTTPVRVGAQLRAGRELVWENRYELPERQIIPGDSFAFSFLAFVSVPVDSTLSLTVDVVREQCFWFRTKGSIGYEGELPVSAAEAREQARRDFETPALLEDAHVLIIAPTIPLFDRETGGRRLMTLLEKLRFEGISVTFLYDSYGYVTDPNPYLHALTAIGVRHEVGVGRFLQSYRGPAFSTAILGWHATASSYGEIVRRSFPLCRIVVDSVDVHWVRESRGVASGELAISPRVLEERKSSEIAAYRMADEVWAVTEEDREAILHQVGDQRVKVVSNLTDRVTPIEEDENVTERDGIIFVGGFTHPPNIGSALKTHTLVNAWRKRTGARNPLYIVGNAPPAEIQALHDGELTFVTGFVPSITPWYQRSAVMMAPITYGAGIKGKICDAISHGVPVITTTLGNEGLGLRHRSEAFICESDAEYFEALDALLLQENASGEMVRAALHRTMRMTGLESAWPVISASLAAPKVTGLIVSYNARELLVNCVRSLSMFTRYPSFRLAVLFNGCNDGSFEAITDLRDQCPFPIDLIKRRTNEFFVHPNNELIARYPESDVVLINNDMEFSDGHWLAELVDAAYSSPLIGAAGGILRDGEGRVLEAGNRVGGNGFGEQLGRGKVNLDPSLARPRYVGFVSGALLYMRRDALDEIGALDTLFHPMYYEDVDWQFRLHRAGLHTVFTPRVQAIHREGSSAGTDPSLGMKRFQEINRTRFLSRYSLDELVRYGEIYS